MVCSLVNLGEGHNVVAVQIIDDGQLHFTGESMPGREGLRKHGLVNRCFDTASDYIAEDDRRYGRDLIHPEDFEPIASPTMSG